MSKQHLGVGVIVRNRAGTRFYVQQKDAEYRPYPLAYSLFGGASEAGETPAQALARELVEELGDASEPVLAAGPSFVEEHRVGPRRFRFCLFEAVLDDAALDLLAEARVLEGERGCVVSREQLRSLPFVWGLEAVVCAYLDGI